MTRRLSPPSKSVVLFFGLLSLLFLGWLIAMRLPTDMMDQAFTEGGPVEATSVAFLALAFLILAVDMVRSGGWARWHLALLTAALALRELDMDKALTQHGILSARLYSSAAPLEQKIAGAFAIAALVWASLRLLRRDLLPWVAALRRKESWAWLSFTAFGLYCVAKTLDGAARKLATWGIALSDDHSRLTTFAEEGLELVAAIFLLLSVLGWQLRRKFSRCGRMHS